MASRTPLMPLARKEGLIVEEIDGETLVYDLTRHTAHCLNRTAALVWKCCDGRTTVARTVSVIERECKSAIGESAVWMALDRLARAQLLMAIVEMAARNQSSEGGAGARH